MSVTNLVTVRNLAKLIRERSFGGLQRDSFRDDKLPVASVEVSSRYVLLPSTKKVKSLRTIGKKGMAGDLAIANAARYGRMFPDTSSSFSSDFMVANSRLGTDYEEKKCNWQNGSQLAINSFFLKPD